MYCFLLSPSNYHLIISIYYTSYLSAVVIQDLHLTTNLAIIILEANKIRNSYFVRLPRLWNSLPPIDLNQSFSSIKTYIYNYLLKHFEVNFNQFDPCSFHYLCTCSNCYLKNQTTNFVMNTADSD